MRTWTIRRNCFCFKGNSSASLPITRSNGMLGFGSFCFKLNHCLYWHNWKPAHQPFLR